MRRTRRPCSSKPNPSGVATASVEILPPIPVGSPGLNGGAVLAQAGPPGRRRVRQGLVESPRQLGAFHAARHALDQLRPDAARDLRAAFVRDMQMVDDTAAGDTRNAMKAMEWERRYRTDPQLRADQFVKSWRQLGDRHELFERRGDERAAVRVAAQMTGLAKTLERDPQVESLLRGRDKELGVPPYLERPLSQALPDWIGWGRGRGLGR